MKVMLGLAIMIGVGALSVVILPIIMPLLIVGAVGSIVITVVIMIITAIKEK